MSSPVVPAARKSRAVAAKDRNQGLMREPVAHATIAPMSICTTMTLRLELELDIDPIAGVLRGATAEDRPFVGWMQLTRAIELSLDTARAARFGDASPGGAAR